MVKEFKTIRIILDRSASGCENMARDEALFLLSGSLETPVLRLYNFHPPCISIGRSQQYPGCLDIGKCVQRGIDVVRRPTGGLSILHMNDFTYSMVLPLLSGSDGFDMASFSLISQGIVIALENLGVKAEVVRRENESARRGQWCFTGMFGIDIEWNGKKICGSAQRSSRNAVLQHGTILISRPVVSVRDLVSEGRTQEPFDIDFESHFITLVEAGADRWDYESVSEAFILGFSDSLQAEVQIDKFRPDEVSLSERLCRHKYRSDSWLKYGRHAGYHR